MLKVDITNQRNPFFFFFRVHTKPHGFFEHITLRSQHQGSRIQEDPHLLSLLCYDHDPVSPIEPNLFNVKMAISPSVLKNEKNLGLQPK